MYQQIQPHQLASVYPYPTSNPNKAFRVFPAQEAENFREIFSKVFETAENAFDYCLDLAQKCGFGVRRRTSKKSTIYIVCSREGRPDGKKEGIRQRHRISGRCDCEWRIVLYLTAGGKWEFRPGKSMIHNHSLFYDDRSLGIRQTTVEPGRSGRAASPKVEGPTSHQQSSPPPDQTPDPSVGASSATAASETPTPQNLPVVSMLPSYTGYHAIIPDPRYPYSQMGAQVVQYNPFMPVPMYDPGMMQPPVGYVGLGVLPPGMMQHQVQMTLGPGMNMILATGGSPEGHKIAELGNEAASLKPAFASRASEGPVITHEPQQPTSGPTPDGDMVEGPGQIAGNSAVGAEIQDGQRALPQDAPATAKPQHTTYIQNSQLSPTPERKISDEVPNAKESTPSDKS